MKKEKAYTVAKANQGNDIIKRVTKEGDLGGVRLIFFQNKEKDRNHRHANNEAT